MGIIKTCEGRLCKFSKSNKRCFIAIDTILSSDIAETMDGIDYIILQRALGGTIELIATI